MSSTDVLAQVAAGKISPEEGAKLLTPPLKPAKVVARITPKGTLWLSLGYKATPGCAASATLPKHGWEAVVKLVEDGTIPNLIKGWDDVPKSSSAATVAV